MQANKATAKAILGHLHRFFFWLAGQSGYKSRFTYTDADYFNLSEKDCRVASASRPRPVPTLEQLHHVLEVGETIVDRRRGKQEHLLALCEIIKPPVA